MSLVGTITIFKYGSGIFIPDTIDSNSATKEDQLMPVTISGYENLKSALHGDRVQIDTLTKKLIKVCERAKHNDIPGILELRSKVIYGMTKRGVPIYQFKPSNKAYPGFLVASTLKRDLGNQYALVNFQEWSPSSKLPSGIMLTVLGPVGDLTTEYEHVIHRYGLAKPTFKNLIKRHPELGEQIKKDKMAITSLQTQIRDQSNVSVRSARLNLTDLNVFSIDPEGCEDIDDALHIRMMNDDTGPYIEVGVHIADVAEWIPEGTSFDLIAKAGLSTVYAPHKRVDILPPEYATEICSLKPGQIRYAITTFFNFDMDGILMDSRFALSTIKSKHALSYELANQLLLEKSDMLEKGNNNNNNSEICTDLALFRDLVIKMRAIGCIDSKPSESIPEPIVDFSHAIVETFMILTNKVVAETLCKELPKLTILRSHRGSKKDQITIYKNKERELSRNGDKETIALKALKGHINIITMEAAEYVLFDAEKSQSHEGLNMKCYTHFTSPIRRYVDLVNHRLIRLILQNHGPLETNESNVNNLNQICEEFNNLSKNINKAEREFTLLTLISQWQNLQNSIKTSAYITQVPDCEHGEEQQSPHVTIFIPKYNISKKVRVHHKNIDTLKTWSSDGITLIVTDRSSGVINKYDLLQKIQIEIVPNMQSEIMSKKIKIKFHDDL